LTSRGHFKVNISIFNNTGKRQPEKAFYREIIQTIVVGIKRLPACDLDLDPESKIKVISRST